MRDVFTGLTCSVVLCLAACGTTTGGGGYFPIGDGTSVDQDAALGDSAAPPSDTQGTSDTAPADLKITPDVAPVTIATCTAVSQCAHDDCNTNWSPTCGQACLKSAATAAAPSASALLACAEQKCHQGPCQGSGKPDEKCMEDCTGKQCYQQLAACWEQGAGVGQKGCSTALDCFNACEQLGMGKFTCQATCYTNLSAAGRDQFKTMAACIAQGGAASACYESTLTCLADGKQGQQTCYDVFPCVQQCGNDTTCQGACYGKGTGTAQKQLLSLLTCVTGSKPDDCFAQTVTCATPSGSSSCMDLTSCVPGCPSGSAQAGCVIDCLHGATQKGADDFGKLAVCMQQKCPGCSGQACQSCATSKCLTQALACNGM